MNSSSVAQRKEVLAKRLKRLVKAEDPDVFAANNDDGSPKFLFRPKVFHPAVIDWLKARIESSLKAGRTVRVPWLAHDLFAEWKLAYAPARPSTLSVLKRLVGAKWAAASSTATSTPYRARPSKRALIS
jgi:hypothetical protein